MCTQVAMIPCSDWRHQRTAKAYVSLAVRDEHITVRKQDGQPKGRNYINGIEGFWSNAKHWLYPYCGVPHKLFHLYLWEVCYCFNHQHEILKPLVFGLMMYLNYGDIRQLSVRIR